MGEFGHRVVNEFARVYCGSITIYFVVGVVVTCTNPSLSADRKIQSEGTPHDHS